MRIILLLLLTLPLWADDLKGKTDKSAPAGWLRYSFGSGPGLSVVMPGRPKPQNVGSASGIKNLTIYVSSAQQTVTLIEVIDFSLSSDTPGFRQSFYPAAFSEFKSSFEKSSGLKLKVLGRKPAQLGKLTGFEENYDSPKTLGRLRIVMLGKRGFALGAFVPKNSAKLMDRFVQSARLTP